MIVASPGYFILRRKHRDRFVNAMVESCEGGPHKVGQLPGVRLLHINGPWDAIAGRRMADRYLEVMPQAGAHVNFLGG